VEAISGNLITVNPGEMHDGAPVGRERSWSMLYFSQQFVSSVVADLSEDRFTTREFHAPVVADTGLARLFLRTREAASDSGQGAALEERLIALLGLLFGATSPPIAVTDRRLAQVRERIDDDPAGRHPLADLAILAGLSRFHTLRAFARLTGFTPHAYVMQRRLNAARQLIRYGAAPAAAAVEAGFADQSHMHRVFVARHGFTPGAYANACRRTTATSFKTVPPRAC
jgi:AraC-like DNA-binding protein